MYLCDNYDPSGNKIQNGCFWYQGYFQDHKIIGLNVNIESFITKM